MAQSEHDIEGLAQGRGPTAHDQYVQLAVQWLRRTLSAGGHGCQVALSECCSGWDGEQPDALGWRHAGFQDGTVLVEVKVSRADFLADRNKPFRVDPALGMGVWRYYLCPEGLIQQAELPLGWGLLWVNGRGRIKAIRGPAAALRYFDRKSDDAAYQAALDSYAFQVRNVEREMVVLSKTVARIPDVHTLNVRLREANARAQRLARELMKVRAELSTSRNRTMELRHQLLTQSGIAAQE